MLVEEADVAGGPPAVGTGPVGAVGPVAAEQVGAADLDLAGVAALGGQAEVVHQPETDPGERRAERAGQHVARAEGAGHDRGRLGEPVALVHGDAGLGRELLDHRARERRRAGQHQADRRHPLRRSSTPSQCGKTGGCDRDHRDALVGDQVEGALGVEPVAEHERGSLAQDAPQHGVEAVDVEERQHPEDDVVGVDHRRLNGSSLLDVGQQSAVGQHRGSGVVGGAAGVEQAGQRLGVRQRRHGPRLRAAQVGEGHLVPAAGSSSTTTTRGVRRRATTSSSRTPREPSSASRTRPVAALASADRGGIGDDQAGAGVGDHPGQLLDLGARVHGNRDQLGPQHAEIGRDQLEPVAEHRHHPLAGDHADVAETGGDPVGLTVQIGPGQPPSGGLHEGRPLAALGGGGGRQVLDPAGVGGTRRHPSMVPQGLNGRGGSH